MPGGGLPWSKTCWLICPGLNWKREREALCYLLNLESIIFIIRSVNPEAQKLVFGDFSISAFCGSCLGASRKRSFKAILKGL